MTIYSDGVHVIGSTTIELHRWAEKHNIKKHWYHGKRLKHYDIPKKRREEHFEDVIYISTREIVRLGYDNGY